MTAEEQAMDRINEVLDASSAALFGGWIRTVSSWPGSSSVFKRIAQARSEAGILDHMAELRYGILFGHLGFEVKLEPLGSKGPDLEVSRGGISAIVEVARFRPVNLGPAQGSEILSTYGDVERDTVKALAKLAGKFRQLEGQRAVIAVWNDDEALEELEVYFAAQDLLSDPETPASLQFVILGSAWTSPSRRFYCFPMLEIEDGVRQWISEVESVDAAVGFSSIVGRNDNH